MLGVVEREVDWQRRLLSHDEQSCAPSLRRFGCDAPGRSWHADAVAIYDTIGVTYAQTRRADPHVAAQIYAVVGDIGTVLNVGAGAGSYEPESTVLAVEPSAVMISQSPMCPSQVPIRDSSVGFAPALCGRVFL